MSRILHAAHRGDRMPPLSGWVYVVVGFVVAVLSYIFNSASGTKKMVLFFIIGIAFIVTGFVQVYRKKEEKKLLKAKLAKHKQPQLQQRQYPHFQKSQQIMQQRHPAQLQIARCMYCGVPVYTTQQYCHFCHARLK